MVPANDVYDMDLLADFLEAYELMLARELYHICGCAQPCYNNMENCTRFEFISKCLQISAAAYQSRGIC